MVDVGAGHGNVDYFSYYFIKPIIEIINALSAIKFERISGTQNRKLIFFF